MFCRYCGSHIPDDSLFCAKCGKRLGPRENPRVTKIVQTLRLKTPYPYFALLFTLFIAWTIISRPTHADYSDRKSTRLNSSHSQISYAVFCLKKKNIITSITRLT